MAEPPRVLGVRAGRCPGRASPSEGRRRICVCDDHRYFGLGTPAGVPFLWLCCSSSHKESSIRSRQCWLLGIVASPRLNAVVGKLLCPQSQMSTGQQLKFLWRATFFKLKFLLMPLLQNRLPQAEVFCRRATFKGPKSHMWLASRSLPTTVLGHADLLDFIGMTEIKSLVPTAPYLPWMR